MSAHVKPEFSDEAMKRWPADDGMSGFSDEGRYRMQRAAFDEGRLSVAALLRRRAAKEAPNAKAALEFMAGVIEDGREMPEHMLGPVSETKES